MEQQKKTDQSLNLFSLIMIGVVSVVSLKNLSINAQYGFSLISFYLIAGITFLIPLTWVANKFTILYPIPGGSYLWIRQAFGYKFGNLSMMLIWIYNMVWYPTLFIFITTTLSSFLFPELVNNKSFIFFVSAAFFWFLTLLQCYGLNISRKIIVFGALLGTLIPITVIIGFALYSLYSGEHSATPFTWHALLPQKANAGNLAFFSNVLFSLIGLEVIAVYAGNVDNPKNCYPKAFTISAFIVFGALILGSLALCILMPAQQIAIANGLIEVVQLFFKRHPTWGGLEITGICIIVGCLSIASSWMISLARVLQVVLYDSNKYFWLQRSNKKQIPTRILLLQAIIYTLVLFIFLYIKQLINAYWILSVFTAQCALLYYLLFFGAAVKLLQSINQRGIYNQLNIILPIIAICICFLGIVLGFITPEILR